jgi:hypothetical protein
VFHWYNSCPQVPYTQAIHRKRYQITLFTDTPVTVHSIHQPQLRFRDIRSRAPELSQEVKRARRAPLRGCTLPSGPPPNVPPLTRSQRARRQHLTCAPEPTPPCATTRASSRPARSHRHALPRANGSGLGLCGLNCGHGRLGRSGSGTGSH